MGKGRPRKEVYIPNKDSIKFAEYALRHYNEFVLECRAFEKMNETLFQKIKPDKVREMMDSGVLDGIPEGMMAIMDSYLDKKEKVLLVSAALAEMPEEIEKIVRLRCIEGKSQETVVEETGISDRTVLRKRKEGIRLLAEQIEVYMWCKAIRALGLD